MKEKKLYVCEICNTQYNEPGKALECEKTHKKLGKNCINNTKYHAKADYPDKIEITFEDGKSIWYKR